MFSIRSQKRCVYLMIFSSFFPKTLTLWKFLKWLHFIGNVLWISRVNRCWRVGEWAKDRAVSFSFKSPATSAIKTHKPQLPLAVVSVESRSQQCPRKRISYCFSKYMSPLYILWKSFDVDLQMDTLDFSFCLCKQSKAI